MCPRTMEEFVGQEEILGKDKLLYRMIKADRIRSIILYGPPGTGKTSLSRVIAQGTKSGFQKLNAVAAGIADIKRIVEEAKNVLLNPSGRTVLFIDEIHRFNKAQQDALLPFVEDGTIILIGATTENPYFEVNKALISRSSVFMLKPLGDGDIEKIIKNALVDETRGLGLYDLHMDEDTINYLSVISSGDARVALNALELAVITSDMSSDAKIHITKEIINDCIQKRPLVYDKSGDSHYDNISAFIKSMRGSDPDGAVHYLAKAIYAGEDPEFLARRIIIAASEDVGMANPSALQIAVAAARGVKMIGMPESRILLSQAAIAVAMSPKSNSCYKAIDRALADVKGGKGKDIPMHLRNAPVAGMKSLGYGVGYKYSHDFKGESADQQYLPDDLLKTVYYEPTVNGFEGRYKDWLDKRREKRLK